MNDIGIAGLQVQSDQVRRMLFTHARERTHERLPDLAAHQPRDLKHRAKRQDQLRLQMQHAVEDDSGQRQALADRLQQLRRQKLFRPPGWRQAGGDHQARAADAEQPD